MYAIFIYICTYWKFRLFRIICRKPRDQRDKVNAYRAQGYVLCKLHGKDILCIYARTNVASRTRYIKEYTHQPHTSTTHINRTHQPHTSTAHINHTHQPHTSTTHINRTHQPHTSTAHINRTHQPHTLILLVQFALLQTTARSFSTNDVCSMAVLYYNTPG